jgi:hypothetical protein
MSAKPAVVNETHVEHIGNATLLSRRSHLKLAHLRPSREALRISKLILAEFELRRSAMA